MTWYQRWGACCAPLLLALVLPGDSPAQVPDTTTLTFLGVPAGASLAQLVERLRALDGRPLGCTRSRRDASVEECRASFPLAPGGPRVEIWLSAIDSLAGIVTFGTAGTGLLVERWRQDLESRYGVVPTQMQGAQRMKQWVRRGRMIRLTWRREPAGTVVSVSLVDGRVLDGWGRDRAKGLQ